jgi:hypothetical protein
MKKRPPEEWNLDDWRRAYRRFIGEEVPSQIELDIFYEDKKYCVFPDCGCHQRCGKPQKP